MSKILKSKSGWENRIYIGTRSVFSCHVETVWKWIAENGQEKFKLTYAQIEGILGFSIDHSFLKFKKELLVYGYQVEKISMKEETVAFKRVRL